MLISDVQQSGSVIHTHVSFFKFPSQFDCCLAAKSGPTFCNPMDGSPTLTSVHDYWKDHSFNYTDLCDQSDVSALLTVLSSQLSFQGVSL